MQRITASMRAFLMVGGLLENWFFAELIMYLPSTAGGILCGMFIFYIEIFNRPGRDVMELQGPPIIGMPEPPLPPILCQMIYLHARRTSIQKQRS
jgi:hypothetical protein